MTSFPFETWPGPYPILLGHDLQVRSLTQIPKCLKDINVKDWTLPSKVPGLIGEKPFGGWTFRIQGSDLRFISRFFGCCWFQKTWPLLFEKGNLRGFEWGDLIDVHPNWWNSYVVHRGSKKSENPESSFKVPVEDRVFFAWKNRVGMNKSELSEATNKSNLRSIPLLQTNILQLHWQDESYACWASQDVTPFPLESFSGHLIFLRAVGFYPARL